MARSYDLIKTPEGPAIRCRKCQQVSLDPKDVKLLRCPKCGYHAVFPAGMGGLLDRELLPDEP